MDYEKFIEEHRSIGKLYDDCRSLKTEYTKLLRNFYESLQNKSSQEYSNYFSKMFDLWLDTAEEKTTTSSTSQQKPLTPDDKIGFSKILDFSSIFPANKLDEDKKIIESILGLLWNHLLQDKLVSSIFIKDDKTYKYSFKNWPLYELINQITKTINQTINDGNSIKNKFSALKEHEKNDVLENTDKVCKYILDTIILSLAENKKTSINWFPKLKASEAIKLPHIIATSDLVGYILDYKFMSTKKRKSYLEDAQKCVEDIYNNLIKGNLLYDAIESYINDNEKEVTIIEYKKNLFSPQAVFIFIVSIIQEVTRKTLTQSRYNIFYTFNKNYRDTGLDEAMLLQRIKKDSKTYLLILHYLDNPVPTTIKKKEEKIILWLEALDKLRFGIFDDYLSTLAKSTKISFDETTVTSIKI